jgi:ketopantoate reductase
MVLYPKWEGGKLREIQMFFPLVRVVVEPKAYRLHIAVPRIFGHVTVAIVACSLQNGIDMVWNLVILAYVKGFCSGFIFPHGNKLNSYQDDDNGECDFFDHDAEVKKVRLRLSALV